MSRFLKFLAGSVLMAAAFILAHHDTHFGELTFVALLLTGLRLAMVIPGALLWRAALGPLK